MVSMVPSIRQALTGAGRTGAGRTGSWKIASKPLSPRNRSFQAASSLASWSNRYGYRANGCGATFKPAPQPYVDLAR